MNMPANAGSLGHRRDALLVACAIGIVTALSVHFELSEWLFARTRQLEFLQLDELLLVLLALGAGLAWYAYRRLRESRAQLAARIEAEVKLEATLLEVRRLAHERQSSVEAERRSIARDLHDELGQHLTALKMDVALLATSGQQTDITAACDRLKAGLQHLQQVVRALIGRLRPVGLDELGLPSAIDHLVGSWRERAPGCTVSVKMDEGLDALDEERRLLAYRVVQEGLTNAYRHAEAQRIDIRVELAGNTRAVALQITVSDDGHGLRPGTAPAGSGLLGMRERLQACGGDLRLSAGDPRGCVLHAILPLQSAA